MDHAEFRFRRDITNALNRLAAAPPAADPDGKDAARKAAQAALDARIKRIEKVTATARANSFWFFGILAYIIVTLMGLGHSAYFSADARADLPVVGFSVNVTSFLYLAPLLLTVVYLYLHNQLELLWDDLSDLPHTDPATDLPIVSRMPVWLLLEFGLQMRDRRLTWRARWRHWLENRGKQERPPFVSA